jgi:hypothetical protein
LGVAADEPLDEPAADAELLAAGVVEDPVDEPLDEPATEVEPPVAVAVFVLEEDADARPVNAVAASVEER